MSGALKYADPIARIPYAIWHNTDWLGVSYRARQVGLLLLSHPEARMAEAKGDATLVPESAIWHEFSRIDYSEAVNELEGIGVIRRRSDGFVWVCDPMARFADA